MVLGGEPPGRVGRRRDFSIAPAARAHRRGGGVFAFSYLYDRTAMADDRRRGDRQGRPPAKRSSGGTSRGGSTRGGSDRGASGSGSSKTGGSSETGGTGRSGRSGGS